MKTQITLTRRWPDAVEQEMTALGAVTLNQTDEPMDFERLRTALETSDVVCPTVTDPMPAELFEGVIKTRLLANFGVGYNHIDVAAARSAGIRITNTPGVLTHATAEIALALLLATARRTQEGERLVRSGRWTGWNPTHMLSTQVTGKVLGIIGMGRIGQALAQKAGVGLGMRIVYFNRSRLSQDVETRLGATYLPLEQVIAEADFLSLNCPATPETRNLINAETLNLMQPSAHLVNTARGDVVDEAALAEALRAGTIAGAGLDVYAEEPRINKELLALENVVLLPHMGSGTVETREAMGRCALENVRAFVQGKALPNEVEA